jgi:predicted ferric reductase
MKPKIHLFDGPLTLSQQLIILLWGALLVGVVALWAPVGVSMLTGGSLDAVFTSIADILGLLATYFALTQFMLMGRIGWIERSFGLDRLASYHRLNGYLALVLFVIHPIFITLHHMAEGETNIISAYLRSFSEHSYTVWALIAELLFVAVVLSSMYIARKHLKFETWYFVHMMVYAAIILASFHQFANGTSLLSSDVARYFWYGLYAFVAVNILVWRFGFVVYNALRFDFTVSRVVRETPTVTSIYIKAKRLSRLKVKPGQFIMVRMLTRQLWWQEHPFTVSWIPKGDELRISVRNVGDYTAELQTLAPGTKVAVSGPFGRFTSDVATTRKRLFIAGGIGITPIRSLAEEAVARGDDAVLLYANRMSTDVPLKKEIDALGLATVYTYSNQKVKGSEHGMIDIDLITRHVPDYRERDIYLCGPPPMMGSLISQLSSAQIPPSHLHYEAFQLHS